MHTIKASFMLEEFKIKSVFHLRLQDNLFAFPKLNLLMNGYVGWNNLKKSNFRKEGEK